MRARTSPGAAFFAAACFQVVGLSLALRLFARMPAVEVGAAPAVETKAAE
jgi:hypothetical protein